MKKNTDTVVELILDKLNKTILRKQPLIERDVRTLLRDALLNCDTAKYIRGHGAYEFGISDPARVLSTIVNSLVEGTVVEFAPYRLVGRRIRGKGLVIKGAGKFRFDDELSLPESKTVSSKNQTFPFLEFLLLRGDETIRFTFVEDAPGFFKRHFSKTQKSMMRPSGMWRVAPEHSGVEHNNFVTREISKEDFKDKLDTIISKHIG